MINEEIQNACLLIFRPIENQLAETYMHPCGRLMLTDRGDDGDVVLSIGWIKKGVKPPSPRRDLCERRGEESRTNNTTTVLVQVYMCTHMYCTTQ